ncbi:hypothetical protein [Endothiovibrio diazotrophicus]
MRPLLLALLLPNLLWPTAGFPQGFLSDDDEGEEVLSPEEEQRAELKQLIREKRFDYVFRGVDTPFLAERRITINRTPLDDAQLQQRILVPLFRIEVEGTTATGAPYRLGRHYLFDVCRRGPEEGRWLDRYPIYRCILKG